MLPTVSSLGASTGLSGNTQGSNVGGTFGRAVPLMNCLMDNQCKFGAGYLPRMLPSSSKGSTVTPTHRNIAVREPKYGSFGQGMKI